MTMALPRPIEIVTPTPDDAERQSRQGKRAAYADNIFDQMDAARLKREHSFGHGLMRFLDGGGSSRTETLQFIMWNEGVKLNSAMKECARIAIAAPFSLEWDETNEEQQLIRMKNLLELSSDRHSRSYSFPFVATKTYTNERTDATYPFVAFDAHVNRVNVTTVASPSPSRAGSRGRLVGSQPVAPAV